MNFTLFNDEKASININEYIYIINASCIGIFRYIAMPEINKFVI